MWETLQNNADWDCFKTPILQEILRIQNPRQVEQCAFSEATRLFQSVGCVKKQTSVSHSSTESEIISLDARLRLDGIPTLDLWDLIVAVLGNTYQNDQVRETRLNLQRERKSMETLVIDFISSNVNSSRKEALLKIFEDNEAVIKMIIKGRSPTMRHVS